jgi:glyoxylase-like metal-dependent hydrolase (beta-lactamase superfamily II)
MKDLFFLKAKGGMLPASANTIVFKDEIGLTLFDTGSGLQGCVAELEKQMDLSGLDIRDTHTIVISHSHPDHIGAMRHICRVSRFKEVRLFISDIEKMIGSDPNRQTEIHGLEFVKKYFDLDNVDNLITYNNIRKVFKRFCAASIIPANVKLRILQDKDTFTIGEFEFEVIETPGHSPGHLSFYEKNNRVLLSGDLIGDDAAIWYAPNSGRSVGYIDSLSKVEKYSVDVVFPSHGDRITNIDHRINSIKKKILKHDDNIMQALEMGPRKFIELAEIMYASRTYRFFPGTIILESHLAELEKEGRIKKEGDLISMNRVAAC